MYAHYHVPDKAWAYYVTEGEPVNDDYEFFGFLLAGEEEQDWNWRSLRLAALEQTVSGGSVVRNERFINGRLTDVVVLPYND